MFQVRSTGGIKVSVAQNALAKAREMLCVLANMAHERQSNSGLGCQVKVLLLFRLHIKGNEEEDALAKAEEVLGVLRPRPMSSEYGTVNALTVR